MSDREMNPAADHYQSPRCRCGMQKMQIDGQLACPNCSSASVPKTGHTIIVTEPQGKDGPVKLTTVGTDVPVAMTKEQASEELQRRKGFITLQVPVGLFPELVIFARKLKLPKKWDEAEKMRDIVEFQVQISKKLEDLDR